MKKAQQPIPVWRFSIAALLLVMLVALMVWRMLNLQVLDTEKGYDFLQDQGDARSHRTEIIPAYRGVISDRNGEPLAVSTPVDSIWMDPRILIGQEQYWPSLAKALGMPLSRLKSKVRDNSTRGFIYLRRHMDPSSAKKILALKLHELNHKIDSGTEKVDEKWDEFSDEMSEAWKHVKKAF